MIRSAFPHIDPDRLTLRNLRKIYRRAALHLRALNGLPIEERELIEMEAGVGG